MCISLKNLNIIKSIFIPNLRGILSSRTVKTLACGKANPLFILRVKRIVVRMEIIVLSSRSHVGVARSMSASRIDVDRDQPLLPSVSC